MLFKTYKFFASFDAFSAVLDHFWLQKMFSFVFSSTGPDWFDGLYFLFFHWWETLSFSVNQYVLPELGSICNIFIVSILQPTFWIPIFYDFYNLYRSIVQLFSIFLVPFYESNHRNQAFWENIFTFTRDFSRTSHKCWLY